MQWFIPSISMGNLKPFLSLALIDYRKYYPSRYWKDQISKGKQYYSFSFTCLIFLLVYLKFPNCKTEIIKPDPSYYTCGLQREEMKRQRHTYHDNKIFWSGTQSFQGFWVISWSLVVKSCPSNIKLPRPVNSPGTINIVIIPFRFQS